MKKAKLSDFREDLFSQIGEDGIIAKIFEIIGPRSNVCIEFGAWDGFFLSNTAALWTIGWKGILIEADQARFRQLVANTQPYNCICLNAYVGIGEEDSLEALLQKYDLTGPVDLLSIDVDGNDYYIFASLTHLRPRVIVVEYNPSMPAEIDIYPEYDNSVGCSPAALVRVARSKGYQLIAMTEYNAFFVVNEEYDKFADYETELKEIKFDCYVNYLISTHNGEYFGVSRIERPCDLSRRFTGKINGEFFRLV